MIDLGALKKPYPGPAAPSAAPLTRGRPALMMPTTQNLWPLTSVLGGPAARRAGLRVRNGPSSRLAFPVRRHQALDFAPSVVRDTGFERASGTAPNPARSLRLELAPAALGLAFRGPTRPLGLCRPLRVGSDTPGPTTACSSPRDEGASPSAPPGWSADSSSRQSRWPTVSVSSDG